MNLLSINPSGAIVEAALIDGTANATTTTGAGGGANATNTATASNTTTNNNMTFGRSDNDTVLQGTPTIAINGTVRWEGVPFAITMMRGTLISVSIDSTRTDNQFGSIPLHGIIMSMTDENGCNLLPVCHTLYLQLLTCKDNNSLDPLRDSHLDNFQLLKLTRQQTKHAH
jgi:hypothetical protein